MSLEKRGDFQLEKSYTDDGTGKKAKIAPNAPDHLVVTSKEDKNELRKKGSLDQQSRSVDEILSKKQS